MSQPLEHRRFVAAQREDADTLVALGAEVIEIGAATEGTWELAAVQAECTLPTECRVSQYWLDCQRRMPTRCIPPHVSPLFRPLPSRDGIVGMRPLVICLAGLRSNARQHARRMIAAAGASYSPDVDQDTTHLVCAHGSVEDEQRRRPKVRAVQQRGRRAAFVVSVHWLTLCLQRWVLLDEALFELPEEADEGDADEGAEEETGGGARREPRPRAAATAAAAQVAQTACEDLGGSPERARGDTSSSPSSSSDEELPLAVLSKQATAADVEKQSAARLQKKNKKRRAALATRPAAAAGAAAGGSRGAAAAGELDSSGDEMLQPGSSAAVSRGAVDGRGKQKDKGGGEGEAGAAAEAEAESEGDAEPLEDLPSYAARLGLEIYEAKENERPSLIATQRGVDLKELLYHNQKFYQQHASSKSRQQFKLMGKSRLKARTCLVLPKPLPVVLNESADAAVVTVGEKTYQCTRKPEAELTCDYCEKTGTMFGDAPQDFDICQKCYDDLTVCVTIRWHKHPLTRHWMEGFQCDACKAGQHAHTPRPWQRQSLSPPGWGALALGLRWPPLGARAGLGPRGPRIATLELLISAAQSADSAAFDHPGRLPRSRAQRPRHHVQVQRGLRL